METGHPQAKDIAGKDRLTQSLLRSDVACTTDDRASFFEQGLLIDIFRCAKVNQHKRSGFLRGQEYWPVSHPDG